MAPDPKKNGGALGEHMDHDAVPPSGKKDVISKALNKNKKDERNKEDDLSEEDLALKQQWKHYVERTQDSEDGIQRAALEAMRQEIRTATSSMTSVPKPLKFLRPHYKALKTL